MTNNFLTFDIEEWYHANYDDVDVNKYKGTKTSLENSVNQLLNICENNGVKSTCFILGNLAKEKPHIVKNIYNQGHEVASHSFAHKLVYTMKPSEFKEDLRISCDTLEQITGTKVLGFRAPSWSIKQEQLDWFYDILSEQGLIYSSSVYPAYTYLYGIENFPQYPHRPIVNGKEKSILEIPQSVTKVLGKDLGFAGGFYLRFFPKWFIKNIIKNKNTHGQSVFIYLHPREIELNQEKIDLKALENFIHYHGIKNCEKKLTSLVENFSSTFVRMDEFVKKVKRK
jgi:polysaccharide deacetylase family protein (PEP-CTERM system associated)